MASSQDEFAENFKWEFAKNLKCEFAENFNGEFAENLKYEFDEEFLKIFIFKNLFYILINYFCLITIIILL